MTAERDFIRKHPDTSSRAIIALASHVGLTITARLVGKVRYYDRKKERDRAFASKTPRQQVDSTLKAVSKRALASETKRKPAPIVPIIRKATPIECQFLVLADEIGYERSRELLDLWRESMRRIVASI